MYKKRKKFKTQIWGRRTDHTKKFIKSKRLGTPKLCWADEVISHHDLQLLFFKFSTLVNFLKLEIVPKSTTLTVPWSEFCRRQKNRRLLFSFYLVFSLNLIALKKTCLERKKKLCACRENKGTRVNARPPYMHAITLIQLSFFQSCTIERVRFFPSFFCRCLTTRHYTGTSYVIVSNKS